MKRVDRIFWLLNRSPIRVPDIVYYWLLDRLTDNAGWRPLSHRERTAAKSPKRPASRS